MGDGKRKASPSPKGAAGKTRGKSRSPSPGARKGGRGKVDPKSKAKATAKSKASAKAKAKAEAKMRRLAKMRLAEIQRIQCMEDRMHFPRMEADSGLLHLAARTGECAVEEATHHLDEDVDQRGFYAQAPLHLSCLQPDHAAFTSLLLAYGADPTVSSLSGTTPLHNAVAHGGAVQVASLLKSPIPLDVNVQNGIGWTPLHLAAMHKAEIATIDLLVEWKADVNAVNQHMARETPLHLACRGHHDCVEALLEAHADAMAETVSGSTPLHLLVSNFKPPPAVASSSKMVDERSAIERPIPLAEAEHVALIRRLLECDASPHATNKAGSRPMDVARGEYAKSFLTALVKEDPPDRWSTAFRLDTTKPLYAL